MGVFFFYPLNGFVCCQPFQPASCTFPTTLWLFTQFLQWNHDMHLKITFGSPHLHPGSSMPTAGITIHYVSAGKGCKGPGRSSHHISLSGPVSEIITCTDKLPGSYFYFFYCTFFNKTGRCLETTDPGFRTHVLFLVTYLKSRSCSLSTFGGFFQGPSLYSLIHHCHQLQGKNPLVGDGRQRGDLPPLPVSPSVPYIRKNMNGS